MQQDYYINLHRSTIIAGNLYSEISDLKSELYSDCVFDHRMSPFGVILKIEFHKPDNNFVFEIYLEGKYPFEPPRILCEVGFVEPSISDGRDILADILTEKWSPKISLRGLLEKLTEFVSKKFNREEILNLGKFHLRGPMSLTTWLLKDKMASYACHELDSKNSNVLHERTLAVTHTDILILSPNPDYLALGLLLNQISLLSIYTLSRSQTSPEKITLKFTKAGKSKQFTRIFLMYQGSDLLSLVSGNYQKLNPTNNILKITEKNEIDLNEPENQEILLDKIANFERKIHKTRQIKQLETLVKLYQKAIQTYSDLDPKFSHKLLQKMHVFLSKPEIMKLFESKTVLK